MSLILHIYLLGDFRLTYGDTLVTTVNTLRLQSLLAYLLLHCPAPQLRSHLAFLLWPDSTEAQARTNLRHQFHLLRQALPEADRFLYADAQTLQWRPDAIFTLDVADFESGAVQAASTTALQKAMELYQGDLLPSCYDDWILPERERLHQMFIEALERLIELLENERDYSTAISYAQRLLRTDPVHEETYRRLMRLYTVSGDRAGALRVYHTCATVLQRELAVEPSPATREVYERLLNAATSLVLPAVPPAALKSLSPLVGRQQEWTQLQAAWRAASAGQAHLMVLAGEAGIGKTRLAEELLQWTGRQGIITASARCYAAEGELAYAPVTTWLRARPLPPLDPLWLSEITRLLPDILPNRPDLSPPGPLTEAWQRQHLFEALARAILEGGRPLLLLIDDLQWCDHDTLEWLHYLLRFDPHAQLLIVSTLRSEEIEANQSLARFLLALRDGGQLTELELSSLDEAETMSLATHVAGEELDPVLAMHLYQETEGNPLFVMETVRAGLSRGAGLQGSTGETSGVSIASLPPRVQAVIETRLAQLSPATRELASLAATIGRAFTFTALARASGHNEDTLVRGLDELWQRRIIREHGADAYDFSHDKLREVAYAGVSAAGRRLLHRRVAQALETIHSSNLDVVSGQVAAHFERAGLLEQAIPYYQRAAQAAQRLYANSEAITFYHTAIEHVNLFLKEEKQLETWRKVATQLYESLGDVLEVTRQADDANTAYQNALTLVPTTDRIWKACLYRKTAVNLKPGEVFQAYDLAEMALGTAPAKAAAEWWQEWLNIQFARIVAYYWLGQVQEMTNLAEKVRPVIEQYGTLDQRIRFYESLADIAFRRDRYVISEETLSDVQAMVAAARQLGDLRRLTEVLFNLAFTLLWHGDLNEAEEQFQVDLELAERIGHMWLQTACLTYLTVTYRKLRRVEETRRYAFQSLARAMASQNLIYIGTAKANLAWVAWQEQNLAETQANGKAALELWQQWGGVYPFQWVALWPLIGGALTQNQVVQALDYARALLEPTQLRLPNVLTAMVEQAIQAWEEGQPEKSHTCLVQAFELAQQMGYL